MNLLLGYFIFLFGLFAYTVATFFILRWMFVAQVRNWADHMEPFYSEAFIDGIRYAGAIVAGSAHEPRGMREDA